MFPKYLKYNLRYTFKCNAFIENFSYEEICRYWNHACKNKTTVVLVEIDQRYNEIHTLLPRCLVHAEEFREQEKMCGKKEIHWHRVVLPYTPQLPMLWR